MFKVTLGNIEYTFKLFYQYDGETLKGTKAVLSQGEGLPDMEAVALCHAVDTPSKVFGRTLATARLAQTYLHPKEEAELWRQLFDRGIRFDHRILKSRNAA